MEDFIQITYQGIKSTNVTIDIEKDNEKLAPFNTLSFCNKIPGIFDN